MKSKKLNLKTLSVDSFVTHFGNELKKNVLGGCPTLQLTLDNQCPETLRADCTFSSDPAFC